MVDDDGVLVAKIISGSVLFLLSFIFGVVPVKLAQLFKWSESLNPDNTADNKISSRIVSALLCFGGGILLATTFLHLLPDINSEIKRLQNIGKIPDFHVSIGECLMMLGFFLIYSIEEIVHYYLHRHQRRLNTTNEETFGEAFMHGISTRNSVHRRFSVPLPHSAAEDVLVSSLRGLLIVLALSIHELFEGFAVGLQRDTVGVYYLFAAVCAHKFVISFCIGVELMVQKTLVWLAFVYIFVYSIVSALGKYFSNS